MSNAQDLFSSLQGAGLSKGAALGVVGNVLAESGASPTATGDQGTSHGLAQWRLSRWDQLKAWATKKGLNPNTFATQSQYLLSDLQTYNGGHLWNKLKGTTQTYTASQAMLSDYERAANTSAAEAIRRGDLAINAGLTNPTGTPLVTVNPSTLAPDTSGSATATGGTFRGWTLPTFDLAKYAWVALGVIGGIGLILIGATKLASPAISRGAALAGKVL